MKNQPRTMKNHEKPTNVTNFVTHAGSQLTWEGGRAGISKNVTNFVTHAGSQLTF